MIQAKAEPKVYSFDQFISWYPENSEVRYELHDGVIIEMPKPNGKHSDLTGSLIEQLLIAIRQMGKGGIWTIPRESIVKPTGDKLGYEPDIIVLNKDIMGAESRWESESIIQHPDSVKLIVEVVSTNWRDDYYNKLRDYEEMSIEEYWIIDYAALGPRKLIGNPKQPTFFVCSLVDGEYQMTPFTEDTPIVSPTFSQFNLSAQEIFNLV
ncbi:MAG: Uma2 family endonuclease [Roseofilum sp. SBFL]|uniref:Uma2 family endonuclease n=1 Tax=unclassified Roseofilum TaxID=2620099 RepID=UPI001B291F77|nr:MULTISPECIES: Uma2 family endonuclease [unclassified Roseofilum]MBP0012588.1 Uma2 family endonuclease [Roseofilum sp. SID3]MBP0023446.1 Uma2 family endonuclease [Roseofilum sp. SID2]MBP0038340.1 Uma2 family endonuclease [Roseofilum sp. SID1]MBP0043846.1 Uma2 family endonuclease [Roseofilum sp. SBFL]